MWNVVTFVGGGIALKNRLWILTFVLLVALVLIVQASSGAPVKEQENAAIEASTLLITEVCAKNESIIADNDGKYRDYIEVYNSGAPVSLQGFVFYDGKVKSEPIGNITLETGEYRVFFISRNYTGFALGASGGDTIQLLNTAGNMVAQTNTASLDVDEVMLYAG